MDHILKFESFGGYTSGVVILRNLGWQKANGSSENGALFQKNINGDTFFLDIDLYSGNDAIVFKSQTQMRWKQYYRGPCKGESGLLNLDKLISQKFPEKILKEFRGIADHIRLDFRDRNDYWSSEIKFSVDPCIISEQGNSFGVNISLHKGVNQNKIDMIDVENELRSIVSYCESNGFKLLRCSNGYLDEFSLDDLEDLEHTRMGSSHFISLLFKA